MCLCVYVFEPLRLLENTSHGLGPGDNNDRILNNQAAIYKIYLTVSICTIDNDQNYGFSS